MRIVRALANRLLICAVLASSLATLSTLGGQVTLAWDANTETDIAGYRVWYGSGSGFTPMDVGNVTSATVQSLAEGTTYSFYATAYDTSGLESAPSATVSYSVPISTSGTPPPPPPPPTSTTPVAPTIVVQPQSLTVGFGNPVQLSVGATGSGPLSYTWYRNFAAIPGATASTLYFDSVATSDSALYYVTVANSAGHLTSSFVSLGVMDMSSAPPTILAAPQSQTTTTGGSVSLFVQANGASPLQFQWFHNGAPIGGATRAGLQIPSAQTSDAGQYTAQVSNSIGTVTSAAASITVSAPATPPPPTITAPSITTQPISGTLRVGSQLSLSVSASGSDTLSYQWFHNGAPILNATGSSFQVAAVQSSDAGSYTVQVSNSAGTVTSAAATITLLYPPTITAQPTAQSATAGTSASFSVQASGVGPLLYQWYKDGVTIAGATGATFSIPSVDQSQAGAYLVVVSNGGGSVTSAAATLTVVAPTLPPQIILQPSGQTLSPGAALSLSVQATGTAPLQFQWLHNGVALGSANGTTFLIPSVAFSDAGTYTVNVSNSAGTTTSVPATVTVLGPPAITVQPQTQSVGLGSSLDLSVQATGTPPLQYQWFWNGFAIAFATGPTLHISSVRSTDAGSYTVNVSNGSGSVASSPAVVTVLTTPSITVQPVSQALAAGAPLSLSVTASGSAPLSYQWLKNGAPLPGATGSVLQIVAVQASDAGTYAVQVTNAVGTVTSSNAIITVAAPLTGPGITTQPLSQNLNAGAALSLSVTASGSAPLSYQWTKNGVPISGAISASFQISSVQTSDAGTYAVQVSNTAGTTASANATITVAPGVTAPTILTPPAAQNLSSGATLSLSVTASGSAPLSYQWTKNGVSIAGATSSSFQIASAQTSDSGSYAVQVSNPAGTVTSTSAVVTVNSTPTPPSITTQPTSQSLTIGATLSLTVTASGAAPLSYQWTKNGIALIGATSPSFQLNSVQTSDAGNYAVRIANSAGGITSPPAIITVTPPVTPPVAPPVVTSQPTSQNLASGAALYLSVGISSSTAVTYQWTKNGAPLTGATGPAFQIPAVQVGDAGTYAVQVANSAGTVTSANASVTVTPPITAPLISTQPASQSLTAGALLSLTVSTTGSAPLNYQWTKNGSPVSGATGPSLQVAAVQPGDAGTYAVQVSNAAGTVTSANCTVTVSPAPSFTPPSIVAPPLAQTLAVGSPLTLSVQVTGSAPLTYQWFRDGLSLGGGGPTLQVSAVTITDAGKYTVKVSNPYGSLISAGATVDVVNPPLISVQPLSQTVAAGSSVKFSVTASGAGPLSFQWTRNGSPISGATANTFQIAAAQSSDAGVYAVQVSNSIGSITSSNATLTVGPKTSAPLIITQPSSQNLTVGGSLSLSVTASGSGPLSYQWTKNGAAIAGATSASFQVPTVQASDAGTYAVKVTNTAGGITSADATVTIAPLATAPAITAQPANQSLTVGAPLVLSVAATGSGPLSYQWTKNGAPISGATGTTFQVAAVQSGDAGTYAVQISNAAGPVVSANATVTVTVAPVTTGPSITAQPSGQTVNVGSPVSLSVQVSGSAPFQYQWFRDGLSLGGGGPTLQIAAATITDAGNYTVKVSNNYGSLFSAPAAVVVMNPLAITVQPASQTIVAGTTLSLSVTATGSGPLTYQWMKNGSPISGATGALFQINAVQASDGGIYAVRIANPSDTVTSANATVTITQPSSTPPATAPVITGQPASQNLTAGAQLLLNVTATGSAPLNYQWTKNGSPVTGATGPSFQIAAVQTTDAGTYAVQISNTVGTVTSTDATVTVTVPSSPTGPSIVVQPIGQTLTVGSTLTLSVQVSGSAPFRYQWFRDGLSLGGAMGPTLQISPITITDAGNYTVKVSNDIGSLMSAGATIVVLRPPVITLQPANQIAALGATVSFSVSANGSSLQYQWFRNGSPISGATGPVFQINSASPADIATYTVSISNDGGTVTSSPASLSLIDPPTITTEPAPQTLNLGKPLVLTVQATGPSPLRFQWFRDGISIGGATNATLQIASVANTDAGTYTVTVSNPGGSTTSAPATVTIINAPVITASPSSQTISVGAKLTLSVAASGGAPLNYRWFHDGALMSRQTNSTLVINPVSATDGGSYVVEVSNGDGTILSNPASITVLLSGPIIVKDPSSQTLAAGSSLVLKVQATGTSLRYQWYRNGIPMTGATTATLTIGPVQSTDSGTYTARVSNPGGAVDSAPAVVLVLPPPSFVLQPTNQSVALGNSLTLVAQASTASGPVQYQWYLEGTALPNGTNNTFVVASVQQSDGGDYTVTLTNPIGSVTSDPATVQVGAAPVITQDPAGQTVVLGSAVTLSVTATGADPLTYQWYRNGEALQGATSSTLDFIAPTEAAGIYYATVANPFGTATSAQARLSVVPTQAQADAVTSFSIAKATGSSLVLRATGKPGKAYEIKNTTSLPVTQWSHAATIVAAPDGAIEYAPATTSSGGFFLIVDPNAPASSQ